MITSKWVTQQHKSMLKAKAHAPLGVFLLTCEMHLNAFKGNFSFVVYLIMYSIYMNTFSPVIFELFCLRYTGQEAHLSPHFFVWMKLLISHKLMMQTKN